MPFKLILISAPTFQPDEHLLICKMFEAGLDTFHYRKPGCSFQSYVSLLQKIPTAFHPHIVLHEHYFLHQKFNLKGSHLNSRRKDFSYFTSAHFALVRNYGKTKTLSCSCHSMEDIENAKHYDYAFLSPVFNSISKAGYHSNFSVEKLSQMPSDMKRRTIALGGCDIQNLDIVKKAGLAGAAILGTVWQSQDPLGQLKLLLKVAHSK